MDDNWYFINSKNFVCAICIEEWIDRDPRILPCQHTFCFECLENMTLEKFNLSCPLCSKYVYLKNNEINLLPKNILNSNIRKNSISERQRKIEYEKKVESYRQREISNENELIEILEIKKNEIIEKCYNEIGKIQDEINEYFEYRRNLIEKLKKNEIKESKEIKKIEFFLEKKPSLNCDEAIVKSGLKFQPKRLEEINDENSNFINNNNNEIFNISNVASLEHIELQLKKDKKKFTKIIDLNYIDSYSYLQNLTDDLICKIISIKFCRIDERIFEILFQSTNILENLFFQNINLEDYEINLISILLSKCTNLKTIDFSCNKNIGYKKNAIFNELKNSSNSINSINLSNCYLQDEIIENISEFLKNCTEIKYLNFSLNKNFGSIKLNLFENLCQTASNLTNLNFSNCNLNEEIIGNISKLFENCRYLINIDFSHNEMIGSTNFPFFQNLQRSSINMEAINFSYCNLNEKNILNISNLLKNCFNLSNIYLNNNDKLGLTNSPFLQSIYYSLNRLVELDVSYSNLNSLNINYLSNIFSKSFHLKYVNLSGNLKIGTKNHSIFKNLRKSYRTLETLRLSNCNLNINNLKKLRRLLTECTNLKHVHLNGNKEIGSNEYSLFKEPWKTLISYETFDINDCNLQEKDFEYLSEILLHFENLKYFDISWNENLNYYKSDFFLQAARSDKTLETINAIGCNFNFQNLTDLSFLISSCKNIKNLNVSFNNIICESSTSFSIFQELIFSSSVLENLNLKNCNLCDKNIEYLSKYLHQSYKLKSIDFSENRNIGYTNFPVFKNLCKSSSTLEYLNFEKCELSNENIYEISKLFSQCTKLKTVKLGFNKKIGQTQYPILKNLCISINKLEILDLNGCFLNNEKLDELKSIESTSLNIIN